MKNRWLLLIASLVLLTALLPVTVTPRGSALAGQSSALQLMSIATPQDGEPGDPVVIGNLGLNATVQVFPYDVDIYGIYLVQGDEVSVIASVPVEHINLDRVTAKLSPDGFKVAYLVEYGSTGFSKLVIMGADGLNSNPLWESNDPGRYITSFAWSHDSEQLAYALSRDSFAAGPDIANVFENPDLEMDPLDETVPISDSSVFTGEIWITDLYGNEQRQLVDHGAMELLGWITNDTGVLFTRAYIPDEAPSLLNENRTITLTTPFAGYIQLVRTDAATSPEVTTLFTNTAVLSRSITDPLYIDFYLLETESGEQKLAGIATSEFFETVPMTDTVLTIADLSNDIQTIQTNDLVFTPIITNSSAIVGVSLSSDGAYLAYFTEQTGGLWLATSNGLEHTLVVTQGLDSHSRIVWGTDGDIFAAVSLDGFTLNVLSADGDNLGSLSAIPSEALLVEPLSTYVAVNYNAPFVHQIWDTPNWFNGRCACGPTSTAMALAFYNKIPPNPITIPVPTPHTNDYGFYVPERFGNFQNYVEPGGCPVGYGLNGRIVYNGGAVAWRIQNAITEFGIDTAFDGSPTVSEVKSALDRGHLVILSTQLTTYGHIVLVKGYTANNNGDVVEFIVNDPYGNKLAGSYGQSRIDGRDVKYTWNNMNPTGKWFVEVKETPPVPVITHWKGEYFNNRHLAGTPTLVRNDTSVNFDWGTGAPGVGISPDDFSVRWTRTFHFSRGVYRFRTTTDDGVRLYVNNQLVINKWYDQGATTHESGDVFLPGGNATIRMEYYERGGAAVAKLNWQQVSSSAWRGEYFNNRTLSGNPTFVRNDDSVFFNWGSGGPGGGIGNDNFSVRWTKTLNIPRSGVYRIYARADDGVRVWVNGQLRINGWRDQAPTTYGSEWLYFGSGNHSIQVDYYERGGGAYIRVWMVPAFHTQFYNNRTLSGSPAWTGYYSDVWFNWGTGGPPNTSNDNFSARWTGNAALSGGRYKFCTRTDDGVRLYINGTLVINKWQDQGATTWCTDRDLSRGFHEIKMEYYERGGAALAQMWWSKYSGSDALAAAMSVFEEPEDFDIWALYGDNGYLGPLIEADITSLTVAPGESLFLPLIVR